MSSQRVKQLSEGFCSDFVGICSSVSFSSTEIHTAVVHFKIRDQEARLLFSISIKVDFSFHVSFKIFYFHIQVSEELQSFVFVLFVPQDDIMILDFMRTFDLTLHRFTSFLNDDRRTLVDVFGVRGTCREAEKVFKAEIIILFLVFLSLSLYHYFLASGKCKTCKQ